MILRKVGYLKEFEMKEVVIDGVRYLPETPVCRNELLQIVREQEGALDYHTCSRKGCTTKKCTRHSVKYGYICHDCFLELIRNGASISIAGFMSRRKLTQEEEQVYFEVFKQIEYKRSLK